MKKEEEFEMFFVQEIALLVDDAGMSHSEFGRLVFGNESGPRAWRAARNGERKRGIALNETLKIAEVLKKDYPSLIWDIYQKAKSQGIIT